MVLLHNNYFLTQIKQKEDKRKAQVKTCAPIWERSLVLDYRQYCFSACLTFFLSLLVNGCCPLRDDLLPFCFRCVPLLTGFSFELYFITFIFNFVFVYLSLSRQFSYKYFYINVNSFLLLLFFCFLDQLKVNYFNSFSSAFAFNIVLEMNFHL